MGAIVFTTLDESIVASEFYLLIANSHDFRIEVINYLRPGISFNSELGSIDQIAFHDMGFHHANLCDMIAEGVLIVELETISSVVSAIMLDPSNWNALRTEIKMAEAMEFGP